jgi:hypothetical protein
MKQFLFAVLLASIAFGQWSVELIPHIFYSEDSTLIWSDIYYFGTNPSATDGYDAGIDNPTPPFPPSGPFFYFVIDDLPINHLREDFRSSSDDTIIWTIAFGSMGFPMPESLWFTWDTTAIPPTGDYRIDVTALSRGSQLPNAIAWDDAVEMRSECHIPYYTENYFVDVIKIRQVLTTGIYEYSTSSRPSTYTIFAYPNPFNSAVSLTINLPNDTELSLKIIDLTGRAVEKIADGNFNSGNHSFVWNAVNKSSGIYFAVLSTDGKSVKRKLLLVK